MIHSYKKYIEKMRIEKSRVFLRILSPSLIICLVQKYPPINIPNQREIHQLTLYCPANIIHVRVHTNQNIEEILAIPLDSKVLIQRVRVLLK